MAYQRPGWGSARLSGLARHIQTSHQASIFKNAQIACAVGRIKRRNTADIGECALERVRRDLTGYMELMGEVEGSTLGLEMAAQSSTGFQNTVENFTTMSFDGAGALLAAAVGKALINWLKKEVMVKVACTGLLITLIIWAAVLSIPTGVKMSAN